MNASWYRRLALLLVFVALATFAACGGGDDDDNGTSPGGEATFVEEFTPIADVTTQPTFPLNIQRSDGEALILQAPPTRIISLSPAATEIFYAIGAEAALIAVDNQANFPLEAAAFPTRVDAFEPNVETLAGLTPDLVFVASDSAGIVAKLDELNIPVLYFDIDSSVRTINDVLGQIRLLGQVTERDEAALALISNLAGRARAVEDALRTVATSQTLTVYHELDSTFYTASEDTFIGDLYRILRMKNIAGDGGGQAYPQLTQEVIIAANPDVIVLADEDFGVTIDSVKARPGWSAMTAVQSDRILGINADIVSRPGPRIVDALEMLAKFVYPDRFQ